MIMRKVKKEPVKSIKSSDLMRLSFFANRFGISPSKLCWGILVSNSEDCEVILHPVVIVKGEKLYIDIINDVISPYYNICGCLQYALQAVKRKVKNGYLLSARTEEIVVTEEDILRAYNSKIFSAELVKKANKYN